MNIQELREVKEKLEQDLLESITHLTTKFYKKTGLTIHDVQVNTAISSTLQGDSMMYITDVDCTVKIFN